MNLCRHKYSICPLISGIRGILLSQAKTILSNTLYLCKTEQFHKIMIFFTQDDPEIGILTKLFLYQSFAKKHIVGPKNR